MMSVKPERMYVMFALYMLTGAVPWPLLIGSQAYTALQNTSFTQIVCIPAICYGIFIFLKQPGRMVREFSHSLLPLLISALCVLSVAWSIDAAATARRAFLVSGMTIFAYALSTRFDSRTLLRMVAVVMAVVMAVNMLGLAISPEIAVHQDEHYPAVRGFFWQKNIAGRMLLMGAMCWLVVLSTSKKRLLPLTGLLFCAAGVLLTLSVTATMSLCLVILSYFGIGAWQRARILPKVLILTAVVIGLAGMAPLANDVATGILDGTGRDMTLTGRTYIWSGVIDETWSASPWLGFGYEAFWTSKEAGASILPWYGIGKSYLPPQAHNGVIQAYSSFGLVGVVVALFFLLSLVVRAVKAPSRSSPECLGSTFAIPYAIYFVVINMTESEFLSYSSLIWTFTMYVYIALGGNKRAQRQAKCGVALQTGAPVLRGVSAASSGPH